MEQKETIIKNYEGAPKQALLELIRLKQVIARQSEHLGEIMIYKVTEAVAHG